MSKQKPDETNLAFIDGQNLHMGTAKREQGAWHVHLSRFRTYLRDKYQVETAYYFLGVVYEEYQDLYEEIQRAGFVLIFREHSSTMVGKKKGNVDSDIIFQVMKRLYLREHFDRIVLVSGDGDYKLLVDFLIQEKKLVKLLFPYGKFASSLYKKLGSEFFDALDAPELKKKISRHSKQKEKGSLGS
jgi:uncharacterized LabA/DUF88 family protein